MPDLSKNVNQKKLELRLGHLFRARSLRRELELPVIDLSIKIWWLKRRLLACWRGERC
jgi:hypothetical protein